MAGQSALSRWTRFLTSFDHIDAAIEAADPSVSRDEFRRLRVQIVEMLCAAAEDKADGLSLILDGVMSESLVTLQSVPADVVPRLLASCTDLANAVGALRSHASERVRGLARCIIGEWKASVERDIAKMNATMAKLDALSPPSESMVTASHVSDGRSHDAPSNPKTKNIGDKKTAGAPGPRKTAPRPAGINLATMAVADKQAKMERTASSHVTDGQSDNMPLKHQAKIRQENRPPTKKMAPVVVRSDRAKASEVARPEERMEATKRKLHEGYQEAADSKRQRKIQVIKAPKMLPQEHKQSKTHAIMRERSRETFGTVRRSLISSFDRV